MQRPTAGDGARRPPPISLARDAAVLALTALAWTADLRLASRGGWLGGTVAVAAGTLTALTGFVVHEWGHLAGALASGSTVHFPGRLAAPLLFHFDTARNDRRQFLSMSYGGFAASALVLAVLIATLPLDRLSGRTAAVLAGLGTLVSLVAEVPTAVRVARGAELPSGYAFTPPRAPST